MPIGDMLDKDSRALLCELLDRRNNDVYETPTDADGLVRDLIVAEAQRQGLAPREPQAGRRARQDVAAMYAYYMALAERTMGDVGREWGIERNSVRSLFLKRGLPLKTEQLRPQHKPPRLCECGSGRPVMAKDKCNLCYGRGRYQPKRREEEGI